MKCIQEVYPGYIPDHLTAMGVVCRSPCHTYAIYALCTFVSKETQGAYLVVLLITRAGRRDPWRDGELITWVWPTIIPKQLVHSVI